MFPMRNYNILNFYHGHRGNIGDRNIGDRYVRSDHWGTLGTGTWLQT